MMNVRLEEKQPVGNNDSGSLLCWRSKRV